MTRQNGKLYTDPAVSPAHPKPSDLYRRWFVYFRYYDPSKDRWKQFRIKAGINEAKSLKDRIAESNALKVTLREELENGWNPFGEQAEKLLKIPYTIQEAIDYVLAIKTATLKKKSLYTYRYISRLLLEYLVSKNLGEIHIRKFNNTMAQECMDRLLINRGYTGRTFNNHLLILRTIFNCFIEREWINKNPFKAVRRKQQVTGRNLAYTEQEKLLLDKTLYAKDPRMYYFSQVMFHCFIRRSELISLKVKDIDLVNKTIVIPGGHAKNKHQESVVIPKGLEPVLQEMKLSDFPSEYFVFGARLETGPIAYKNANHVSSRHNDIVKSLGIDNAKGLYSHKHTGVCAYYYATGKDLYSLMRQLRHRDISTTQVYLKSLGLIQNDAFRNAMVA